MRSRDYEVLLEWDPEAGVWVTHVPTLNGISTFGKTREDALANTREAIQGYMEAAYLEGKISAGKAAEVLGLSKAQFLDLLDERNIPHLDADLKELEREAATAQAASRGGGGEIEPVAPQQVRIVPKGRLWVVEPVEPGEPLSADTVRQTQNWIRDRGLDED